MVTKTCPSCHEDVPTGAYRCKSCFHDFNVVVEKKAGALMTLLTLVSAMAVLASVTFYVSSQKPSEIVTRLSEENQAIISMKMTSAGLELETAYFNEISKVEHVNNGSKYSVLVHTHDGRTIEYEERSYPLSDVAATIADTVKKHGYTIAVVGVESFE
jgi:predicted nucleic acid-binding Zn ribbon protein